MSRPVNLVPELPLRRSLNRAGAPVYLKKCTLGVRKNVQDLVWVLPSGAG